MRSLGPKFPNIAEEKGRLFTRSSYTGFGEDIVEREGELWRPWDARRSKLAAGISKRISQLGIREGESVLYLGASHGYTPSFVADIVGEKGVVYCLDFSHRVVRDLLKHCRARQNMVPVLADAGKLETYSWRVPGVDVVFQDVSQRDQVSLFVRACERFLKPGGFGILSLKARSVDSARDPRSIFKESYAELERSLTVVDMRELAPLERDHALFVVKKK